MSAVLRLTLGAAFAALALGGQAHADTRTLHARQLVLNGTLSGHTTIEASSALHGELRLMKSDGLDCLTVVEGDTLVIDTSRCGDEALRIEVPHGLPIVLNAGGSGSIRLGDIEGPLTLSVSGDGNVTAGPTGPLTLTQQSGSSADVTIGPIAGAAVLSLAGSGDVKLGGLTGTLALQKTGSGDIAIGEIHATSVDIDSTGSGDMLIGRGSIGSLRVKMNGSGDFATAATSQTADLSAHGGGDMRVGPVVGTVHRDAGGGSDIHMGSSEIVGAVIADVAHAIGNSDDSDDDGKSVSHRGHSSSGVGGTLLHIAIFGFLAYLVYRIIRRGGGLQTLMRRRGTPLEPAPPSHAGVVALCETLARTEQRLGRVEAYVTSREFDLQQKFREMGR